MTEFNMNFSRRQALTGLGGVSVLAVLPGCAQTLASADTLVTTGKQAAAEKLLENVAYNLLKHEPDRATSLGVDTGDHAALRGQLTDKSARGVAAYAAQLRADLEIVRRYPREGLDADTVTNLDVVESAYQTALEGFALPYGDVAVGSWRNTPYVVIQNVGAYLDMPRFMDTVHPIREPVDVDAYAARLELFPQQLAGETDRMKAARSLGVVPPDFLIEKAIPQLQRTLKDAMSGELFLKQLAPRLAEAGISRNWPAELTPLVKQEIAAALEAQLAELYAQRKIAKNTPGIWAQPRGDEWYAWSLKASTTTSLSPDEIHQIGLEELASLHGRMDPILREIGYTTGTVGERMQALGDDPRYKFAEGDPGRAEIMAFINERVDWIKAQMPRAFNTLVDPNMEIRRLPPAEEPGAPGAYGGAGSKDGSIPGRMWINLRTTDLHRKYDLPSLTYHETIPGHVWEGEYSNRLPLIRSILAFGAFSEGWALYGEQLGDELGSYDAFKVGQLGYLQSLAFRACRLVVDTGLHHKRWSREQARQFFVERNGSKLEEVKGEVDRYCSWAGQACSYKIGHSEIVRQRARAQTQLGGAYDFKAFNDAVILGGNVPMDVLAKNVGRYISGERSI